MTDFFNLEEFGFDQDEAQESEPEQYGLRGQDHPVFEDLPQELSEAESRLQRAMLYKQFLSGSIFSGTSDAHTREVEGEFRQFAIDKLNELLGLKAPAVTPTAIQSPFDEDEVKALKAVAGRMLQDAKMKAKAKSELIKKPNVEEPPKTELRRVEVAPPKAAEKPRPQRAKIEVAPPRAASKPGPKPKASGKIPKDEEIVKKGGKTYKIRWVETSESQFPGMESKIDGIPPGGAYKLPTGVIIHRTEGGELYKIVSQDLTKQAVSSESIPFPSIAQYEVIAAMKSAEAVGNASPGIANIVSKL
jgi:hypothetical protein